MKPTWRTFIGLNNHLLSTCHAARTGRAGSGAFRQPHLRAARLPAGEKRAKKNRGRPISIIRRDRRKKKESMAQAMASMAGLRGASQAVLEGGLMSSTRLPRASRPGASVARAQHQQTRDESSAASGRRSVLRLLAASVTVGAFAKKALAEARPLKIEVAGPGPDGKTATAETDEAADTLLPLKQRFYITPLPPEKAAIRAKESAKDILNVKSLIDKKQWPYVQNDLRLKASYLRYDLNTVISAKPKDQKKPLKELTKKLFDNIDNLDYAARQKSTPSAEKYYAETVSALNDVLAKLG